MNSVKTKNQRGAGYSTGLRRWALSLAVAVTSSVALSAWAQPMGHEHPRSHDEGMMGSITRGDRMMERMLDAVNATDGQRMQIKQIMQSAMSDLAAQRQNGRALHQQLRELFTAPTVDANAVEQVRQQMLAQHDQASRRMMAAMLDASRVLSPEQRVQWAEKMKRHDGRPGAWHRPTPN